MAAPASTTARGAADGPEIDEKSLNQVASYQNSRPPAARRDGTQTLVAAPMVSWRRSCGTAVRPWSRASVRGACLSPTVFRDGEFRFSSSRAKKAVFIMSMSVIRTVKRSSGLVRPLNLPATLG